MIKSLTIVYTTSRDDPKIEWFADSLIRQLTDFTHVIVVHHNELDFIPEDSNYWIWRWTPPKPNIWQGKHRITSCDWWAKSNALNTGIIYCDTDFIAFCDDRCVLGDQWMQSVRDAMEGSYAVCGSYEKHANMKVTNGIITDYGELLGRDDRPQHGNPVPTRDWYGGSCALPLEWCLKVNGFSEDLCDGLGSEDSMFGVTLRNAGYPMKYDSRMLLIEDRTPTEIEGALKRADKRVDLGRGAKSWGIVKAFHNKDSSQNSYDIRQHRARVQNGEDLQAIMSSASHYDWYDGQFIGDMT